MEKSLSLSLNPAQNGFKKLVSPNMKMYVGGLHDQLINVLDNDSILHSPINTFHDIHPHSQNVVFIRHLESRYNELKPIIMGSDTFKKYQSETDPIKRRLLALEMIDFFKGHVESDYQTPLSQDGVLHGEQLSQNFAQFYQQHPDIFPERIIISPYLRTKLTAWYCLKLIKGLDINLDFLKEFKIEIPDMIKGSFNGKNVIIRFDDRAREKDFGTLNIPSFLLKEFQTKDPALNFPISKDQKAFNEYYTRAEHGGESQLDVLLRVKELMKACNEKPDKNIMVFSHHLAIIAAVQAALGGSIHMFYAFDKYRKPLNGSLTIFSKLDNTQSGRENKTRLGLYNSSLNLI